MKFDQKSVILPTLSDRTTRPGRVLKYISPSSYTEWLLTCKYKTFLKKLSGHVGDSDNTAVPAAMGSAFDAYAKVWLGHKIGLGEEPKLHPYNLEQNIRLSNPDLLEEVKLAGQNLAEIYITRGLAKRLIDEGLWDLELDIMIAMEGVLLYGLPDATVKREITGFGEREIPIDFKIRGYKNKNGASPTPGYRTYVSTTGKVMAAHNKSREHLEKLHETWAIQCMMYFWMLNPDIPVGTIDVPVGIEEICYGTNGITFTQIRTTVSKEFQTRHIQNIKQMWAEVYTPPIPVPHSQKCHKWGRLCEVAGVCKYYKSSVLHRTAE